MKPHLKWTPWYWSKKYFVESYQGVKFFITERQYPNGDYVLVDGKWVRKGVSDTILEIM